MKERLKKLVRELENKIDVEDWGYARDIAKDIYEMLQEKLKEAV